MMKAEAIRLEEAINFPNYVWERKLDGTRQLFDGNRLVSERGIDNSIKFSHIWGDLKNLNCVLDGEIVANLGNCNVFDITSKKGWKTAVYVVFDILEFEGIDLRDKPLWERRIVLESALEFCDNVKVIEQGNDFQKMWDIVLANKWEGLIGKNPNSRYPNCDMLKQVRNRNWIKVKYWKEAVEEVVGVDEGSYKGAFLLANGSRISTLTPEHITEYRKLKEYGKVFAEFNYLNLTANGCYFQPILVRLRG